MSETGMLHIFILINSIIPNNNKPITLEKHSYVTYSEAEELIRDFVKANRHLAGITATWQANPKNMDHACKPSLGMLLKEKLEA